MYISHFLADSTSLSPAVCQMVSYLCAMVNPVRPILKSIAVPYVWKFFSELLQPEVKPGKIKT